MLQSGPRGVGSDCYRAVTARKQCSFFWGRIHGPAPPKGSLVQDTGAGSLTAMVGESSDTRLKLPDALFKKRAVTTRIARFRTCSENAST